MAAGVIPAGLIARLALKTVQPAHYLEEKPPCGAVIWGTASRPHRDDWVLRCADEDRNCHAAKSLLMPEA